MKANATQAVLKTFFGLLLLAATNTGRGQLIAYEGFNYTAGTSVGSQSGGTGWGGTWAAVTDAAASMGTNTTVGLSYGLLATSGGGAIIGNPSGPSTTTAQIQRQLPNTLTNILGGAGTIWVSFLYQNLNDVQGPFAGFRETGLRLMRGSTTNALGVSGRNGTDILDIGTPNTYAAGASDRMSVFSGSTFLNNGLTTSRGASANTVFVVLRLDVNNTPATDTAYTWFNPALGSEPSTGSAISWTTTDLSGINSLRFQAGNQNASGTNAFWKLDEIRVGLTWSDVSVVPEPATAVFAILGGLGFFFWRKSRR